MILLMPTWRGSHYPEGEAFLDTPYYKVFDSLLSSARLDALLEQYGYTLVFYPHIEMQKHLSRFHAPSERVVLADSALYDVQQLLLDCALLVTDHSSVFLMWPIWKSRNCTISSTKKIISGITIRRVF